MLKIRLTQTGTKDRRMFRLIAIEEAKRRDGKAVEYLGYYNPNVKPEEIRIDRDRVAYWVGKGAQVTDGAKKLLDKTS